MTSRVGLVIFLVILGIGWGLTQALSKIAVSTGYRPLGLIFWQLVIGTVVLGAIQIIRRQRFPLTRQTLGFCGLIALIGTLVPNAMSYAAYPHLPGGIMAIIISTVPLLAFPVALALGNERFRPIRLYGLALGLVGVALIALPESSLPNHAAAVWIPVAMIAPLFYAIEANVVARWGTAGMDPIQAMFGASAVGMVCSLPIALATGQWINPLHPFAAPEWALILSSVVHAFMYAGYVWLVGRAGAVFAAQCSYLVTGSGVLWSILLLGETYSAWVWAALVVLLVGVFLVQPHRSHAARAAALVP